MNCKSLLIASAALMLAAIASADAVTLVRNGAPKATIVLPAKPTPEEEQSASELQKYIKLMSRAELPISSGAAPAGDCVLIGRRPEAMKLVGRLANERTLGYDGIILKTVANRLIVLGAKGRGQLYATYALLQRLGCRFYLPHPDGEVIPSKSTIVVDKLDYVHKPDFVKRVFWHDGFSRPGLAHPEWYSGWEPKVYQGGMHIDDGHAYAGICPPAKYFADHPEYFPLSVDKDGSPKRVSTGQLCLSNPDVVKLAADAVIARFASRPDQKGASLSPNDIKGGWCACDRCRAMDSPDPDVGVAWRVLKFNNEVAEIVRRKYPDKWLTYYAEYFNLPGAPVGMKADPMILPVIVAQYDTMHSIHDPFLGDTSLKGIAYNYNVAYRALFDKWLKIASRLMVYEWYQLGRPPQLPSPMLYAIGDRIKFYRDHGVIGYEAQVIGRCPDNDLTIYVASQMLWDSSQSAGLIIDEFFRRYFAEAGPQMREYYRALHETSYFSDENRGFYVQRSAWSPELIARLYAILDRADRAARQDVVRRRLDRERKSLVVTDKCADAFRTADVFFDKGDQAVGLQARDKAQDAIAFLKSISDEDIVADTRMITFVENLAKQIDKKLSEPAP